MNNLYSYKFHSEPTEIKKLSGAGSNRKYYRISGNDRSTVIGVEGESYKENHAFISLAQYMRTKGLKVPEVLACSDDEMTYLVNDLGDVSLFDLIEKSKKENNEWNENLCSILHKVMCDLPDIQFKTAESFDFSNCCREQEFSPMVIRWDLNYFKYCFLKLTGVYIDEIKLEEEFEALTSKLMDIYKSCETKSFLYRDFQSRNVMVKDGEPYYIDFQSGYQGPFYYDVASFLWQARAAYPNDLKLSLIDSYLSSLKKYINIDKNLFLSNLQYFVYFRLLQVLGAYGFRGLHEHKTMFISPIINALASLSELKLYPYINALLLQVGTLEQFKPQSSKGRLTVRVTSFSFKKGIPEDYSGNGGGFVFDCRAPHNPGRYDEYKKLTGMDQPVIDFLEATESMPNFINHVYGLVDPAVETYLRREFSSLVVNFGCTGGQHRSVYCAQHLAEHLAEKYPDARIILSHREQGIYREYNN